jgi:hypothetical protein
LDLSDNVAPSKVEVPSSDGDTTLPASRVVVLGESKPSKAFDYSTMTKDEAHQRWTAVDRARGTRVSVVQLKAYCRALGLSFKTPKRATFAMIKAHFANMAP